MVMSATFIVSILFEGGLWWVTKLATGLVLLYLSLFMFSYSGGEDIKVQALVVAKYSGQSCPHKGGCFYQTRVELQEVETKALGGMDFEFLAETQNFVVGKTYWVSCYTFGKDFCVKLTQEKMRAQGYE